MQQLAKYDPYSIDEIQFFIQKRKKYSTIKSIIISLLIFSLTIIINYQSLKNIWATRAQLYIQSSDQKLSNNAFTSNYLCLMSKNNLAFNSTLLSINKLDNSTIQTYLPTTIFNNVQQIVFKNNNRFFQCYDISGAVINKNKKIQLSVTGQVDIMMKTYNVNEILGNQNQNYFYYSPTYSLTEFANTLIQSKKIRALIYDSLLIDYQPQQIVGFKNQNYVAVTSVKTTAPSVFRFQSQLIKDDQLTQQITIIRKNIGQILGNFFSWFSIIILLFTYIISPIVDYNFKLENSKNIYNNEIINNIQMSLLSYIKFIVSHFQCKNTRFSKGIKIQCCQFRQNYLEYVFQQLQEDLNLMNLIKMQAIMKTLITQNKYIEGNIVKQQSLGTKKSANQNQQQAQFFLLQEQNQELTKQNSNICASAQQQGQKLFTVKKDSQLAQDNVIKRLIKNVDAGQTTISLISNKGQGYRSSCSTILTFILTVAIFIFLILAGILNLSTDSIIKSMLINSKNQLVRTIQIKPQDMIFRALKASPADNFILQVKIVNQYYDTYLENITLLSDSSCDNYVLNLNQTVGSGWLCLSKPITLSDDGQGNRQNIFIKLTFPSFGFTSSYIEVAYQETNLINFQFVKNIANIRQIYSSTLLRAYQIQVISLVNDSDEQKSWTSYKQNILSETTFKGVSFQLLNQYLEANTSQKTIWDVIDTSWGIFILAFSVLLSKVTNYLNTNQRQKISSNQQNSNRNSIASIISTYYELINKYFNTELGVLKYFYKTPMNKLSQKSE